MRSITKNAAMVVAAFAVVVSQNQAIADGRRDIYFQQSMQRFFDQPTTARELGMAGAGIPTSSDSSSTVGNPAGLGFMEDGEFSGSYGYNTVSGNEHPSYAEIEQNTQSGLVLGAVPLGPVQDGLPDYGNFGLGWSGYISDDYDNSTYDLHHRGNRIHGAYAKALNDSWSVGYGLTWFRDTLGAEQFAFPMDNGFRHTVGVQNRVDNNLTWGADVFVGHGSHDLKVNNVTVSDSNLIEVGTSVGIGYRPAERTLLSAAGNYRYYQANGDIAAGDVNIPVGGDEEANVFDVRVGVEQTITDNFAVRGGYRYAGLQRDFYERPELSPLSGSAKYNAWTLGAGINIPIENQYIKAVKLDYGVEFREIAYDDWEHLVTASIPFGVCQ